VIFGQLNPPKKSSFLGPAPRVEGSDRGNRNSFPLIGMLDVRDCMLSSRTLPGEETVDGSGHYLRGRKSGLGLLGHSIRPSVNPEPTHLSPAFQTFPIQSWPTNNDFPLPANLLVPFLDQ